MSNHSCCYRKVWDEYPGERCIWHAEVRDIEKDLEKLDQQRENEANRKLNRGPDDNYSELLQQAVLSGADLGSADRSKAVDLSGAMLVEADFSGAMLLNADLSEANLHSADLSEANLTQTDLSEANLEHADLSEAETGIEGPDLSGANLKNANLADADLRHADLSEATLREADLSGADLREADLSGADLREADLSGSDLRGTDLSGTTLQNTHLSNVNLNRNTQFDNLPKLRRAATEGNDSAEKWDQLARTYHEVKSVSSENGLTDQARDYHFLEQEARERETRAVEGWGNLSYIKSKFFRHLTGYGVRPLRVVLLMMLLLGISMVVYWFDPGIKNDPMSIISYSVVTFTTSPPGGEFPTNLVAQIFAVIETFGGTFLIVLLGYILSNRERF